MSRSTTLSVLVLLATALPVLSTGNPAGRAPRTALASAIAPPPTAFPTPTTAPAPRPALGRTAGNAVQVAFIARRGATLTLNGRPYQFTGLDAYELATKWGENAGCGAMLTNAELNDFFAGLRPNSVVRVWAWQGSITTNVMTKQRDWGPLDRVIAAAGAHGQRLVLSLASQGGDCDDGHWKNLAWYEGGYRQAFNDDGRGLAVSPYDQYVGQIVARYATSPVVAMWEPVNEPESSTCAAGYLGPGCAGHLTCPSEAQSAAALRTFFDGIGGLIHSIDHNHLVESGVIGSGQCGASGGDYATIHASPGIDVGSYHDYGRDSQPMPGDQWNGLAVRLSQLRLIRKPLVVGEVGIQAGAAVAGCGTPAQRASVLRAKLGAQLAAGVSGVLPWNWVAQAGGGCSFDVLAGDPTLQLIHDVTLPS